MIDTVLLIRPFAPGKKELPFGLLFVGTALKKKGYNVEIIDLHDTPQREDEIMDILSKSPNALVGISAHAGSYKWVKSFTLKIKKTASQTLIVIGGHIVASWEILLGKTGVDYVCFGEGEELLPELIEKINNKESVKNILGLAHKENGIVIKTGVRPLMKNFILIDYDLIDINRYLIHPCQDLFFKESPEYLARTKKEDKLSSIMFSRGCFGACGFCYRHLPGLRQPLIDWSWRHLMSLYEKGVRYFKIDDELFISNPNWFFAFYQKIKDSKINILFRITGLRVDQINDEQLAMLKEIGCIAVNYGIESGSQLMLNKMGKRTAVAQNLAAIQMTKRRGLQQMIYIMFGYEGETAQTLRETYSLLLEADLDPEKISIFYAIPFPGTKIFQECLKRGLIKDEEAFIEQFFDQTGKQYNQGEQYSRYIVQMGDFTREELFGFERKFLFLLYLAKFINRDLWLFKIIEKFTFAVSPGSRANIIFAQGQRILRKIYKHIRKN
jgi:anaerobic magnesium-protoporphyrin IX monomethyl ester cyclase